MLRALRELLVAEEAGQDLIEYALLAAFLAVASVVALTALGPVIASFYQSLAPLFDV